MEKVEIRLQKFLTANKLNINYIGPQNDKIKEVVTLLKNNKPNPEDFIIIDGIWAHQKALDNNLEVESFIFCEENINSDEGVDLIESFYKIAKKTYSVSLKTFIKISQKDDPKGMISICKFPQKDLCDINLKDENIIVILDGIEIPGNIGTILRTCDGAGVDAVFICNRRAKITHPKVIKGSMGAAFSIPIIEFETVESCKLWLKDNNFDFYLTDTRATKTYHQLDYKGRVGIVAGSERYGISEPWYQTKHTLLSIPMLGQCDSLNVAIATTIVIYEASLKQKKLIKRKE